MPGVEDLLAYQRQKDAESFRRLVLRFQGMVYSTCSRTLGDLSETEDAVQETFLKLARSAGSVRGNLGAWLHSCALNAAKDRRDSARARRQREGEWSRMQRLASAEDWRELVPVLDDCIAELPDDERELLVQHYFVGRTQTDLAAERGVSRQATAKQLERVVGMVRQGLRRKGVTVSAAVLSGFLAEDAAYAAVPAALTANLCKIGLVGVSEASGAATAGVAGAGVLTGKAATIVVAGVIAVLSGAMVHRQRTKPKAEDLTIGAAPATQVVPEQDTSTEASAAAARDVQAQQAPTRLDPTRTAIVERLREREDSVESLVCRYSNKRAVTRPELLRTIEELTEIETLAGDLDPSGVGTNFIYTEAIARFHSHSHRMCVRGPLERRERYEYAPPDSPFPANRLIYSQAFDGESVQSFGRAGQEARGSIRRPEQAHWLATEIASDPYWVAFLYFRTPYSEVVAQAEEVSISVVARAEEQFTRVQARRRRGRPPLVLLLDGETRVVERESWVRRSHEDRERPNSRAVLTDYRPHTGRGGTTVWFPYSVVVHYYMGMSPDGELVEYTSNTMTVRDIQLNVDLPDSTFVLEFPPGTDVRDDRANPFLP